MKLAPDADVPNAIGKRSKRAFCLQGSGWCSMHLVPMWAVVLRGLKLISCDFPGTVMF